jgi:hypothetical protein
MGTRKAVRGNSGLIVKSGIRAGSGKLSTNHSRSGLRVKSGVRGGKLATNHNRVSL